MNKRTIITVLVSIVLVVGAFIGVLEFLSYKDVSVEFKQADTEITIYTSTDSEVASLSAPATIKLKEGSYYYVPKGEPYSTEKVTFDITDNQTLEVSPSYSSGFLATLLAKEQSTIKDVLYAAYPSLTSDYILGDEHLAHLGEWYSAKAMQRVSGGNEPDVYRVVLQKEGDTWKVAATPKLALSIADNTSVPDYVIRQANEPLSNEAYALLYPE